MNVNNQQQMMQGGGGGGTGSGSGSGQQQNMYQQQQSYVGGQSGSGMHGNASSGMGSSPMMGSPMMGSPQQYQQQYQYQQQQQQQHMMRQMPSQDSTNTTCAPSTTAPGNLSNVSSSTSSVRGMSPSSSMHQPGKMSNSVTDSTMTSGSHVSTTGSEMSGSQDNSLSQSANTAAPPTSTTPTMASGGGTSVPQRTPTPQTGTQQTREINTATVCRIGQETVQEIVSRIQEVFSYLKTLQPPVGAPNQDRATMEKQARLMEVLKGITQLFKRLRMCWDKAQENTIGMEFTNIEMLIPYREDQTIILGRDVRTELEKKRGESYRACLDEFNDVSQQLTLKNRHLKDIVDQMRNIIWEINTMLAMRQA